jgi:hypothetical protein
MKEMTPTDREYQHASIRFELVRRLLHGMKIKIQLKKEQDPVGISLSKKREKLYDFPSV